MQKRFLRQTHFAPVGQDVLCQIEFGDMSDERVEGGERADSADVASVEHEQFEIATSTPFPRKLLARTARLNEQSGWTGRADDRMAVPV